MCIVSDQCVPRLPVSRNLPLELKAVKEKMSEHTIIHGVRESSATEGISGQHPFNPFLKSFLVFGLDLNGSENYSGTRNVLFKTWTVLVTLCYHYWIMFEIAWYARHRIQENVLAESITVWASVLTFDILLCKRKRLQKVMATAWLETSKIDKNTRKKHEKIILVACCFVWLYTLVFVCQHLVFDMVEESEKRKINPVSFLDGILSESLAKVIFKLDTSIQCFFIQGLLSLTISLYLLLCYNAIQWFRNLKNSSIPTRMTADVWTLSDVQRFSASFENLSKNVRILDSVFSRSVAVWLMMTLTILCIRMVTILNPSLTTTNQMAAVICMTFSRAGVTLVGMSFLAGSLHHEALVTLFRLDDLCQDDKIVLADSVYHEIQMAFARFSFSPTHLTLWDVTPLNRKFLVACSAMMTTYVIISIQMYPNTT